MTTEQSHLMSPIRRGPIRFAVGHPDGLTSNSWRVWTSPAGDVYISCRDNFKEAKVSLHASGRWRMGFTEKAVEKNARLLTEDAPGTFGTVRRRHPPSLRHSILYS
jgi:hypothetical protein